LFPKYTVLQPEGVFFPQSQCDRYNEGMTTDGIERRRKYKEAKRKEIE
jgi:hypothetical protein